jgi:hypothetical protein
MPEQPLVFTPMRMPSPLPRLVKNLRMWSAAFSVMVIMIFPFMER